jgi:hypothetical protein
MSINLDQVLVKKFEMEAIQAFQDNGTGLRNAVRVRDAKGAQSVQFQVLGKMLAAERGAIHTMIPLQDAAYTPKTATVKNYVVSEMTDIFLGNQVGFDERQELVLAVTAAMNRRLDQVIIDALDAASISKTVADNISGSTDNLNTAMLAESARLLGSDVPDTDRHLLCHDKGFYHFIQENDVKNFDISVNKALATGVLPEYAGFKIHKLGDRSEGGLVKSGNDRTNYAWQKMAIGLAINMEPKITIDWEPSFGAHRVTGYLSAGAVVIQTDGTVKITSDEA